MPAIRSYSAADHPARRTSDTETLRLPEKPEYLVPGLAKLKPQAKRASLIVSSLHYLLRMSTQTDILVTASSMFWPDSLAPPRLAYCEILKNEEQPRVC